MTAMPKNFDIRVSLNEVRDIFQVAGQLFGDIIISAVWSVEDCTLTAYHQDEEIETLKGMDALNAIYKIVNFIDCVPNAGGLSHKCEQLAKETGLEFFRPVDPCTFDRCRGVDAAFRNYQTKEDGTRCLFFTSEGPEIRVVKDGLL